MQFLMFLKHPRYEKRQVRFLGWFKILRAGKIFKRVFCLFWKSMEILPRKRNHQKAQESTAAWSTEGKPCQITTKHLIFKHWCAPSSREASSRAQPANPRVGKITHALPTAHSSGKAQLNCAPQDAEASPAGTD